jgi:hypothetical protein
MAPPCAALPAASCMPAGLDPRVTQAFARRFNTATWQAKLAAPAHNTNGDEAHYADKCGTYTKCVKQASPGKVDLGAYAAFRKALDSGNYSDFEAVPLGGTRTLNGPMGSYAFTLCGSDSSQFGDAPSPENQETHHVVPPAPPLASFEYATELIELYWASLLRDVAFTDYHKSELAKAASEELSKSSGYAGPAHNGKVTPELLFRGKFHGETVGPYISQFLITPTTLGALPVDQKYITYLPGFDYMSDLATWSDVQNGISTGIANVPDPVNRYLHDGRGLAAWTHVDVLFQAYFTAYLVLQTIGTPLNPGVPYASSKTQNGFGTFGGPDFAATIGAVAKIALNEVWYQKWPVHLRHRPESGGGLVQLIKDGVNFDGSPDVSVFNSKALHRSYERYGSYLLSQAFPEGSPAHPAYPTGHGTVAGACITILKFFFNGDYVFPNPQVPTADGTGLEPYRFDPTIGRHGPLTINGELHKLARNITFGHGIHAGIHWRSDSDISMRLGEAIALSILRDMACTYAEPFTATITKLDGEPATISNM